MRLVNPTIVVEKETKIARYAGAAYLGNPVSSLLLVLKVNKNIATFKAHKNKPFNCETATSSFTKSHLFNLNRSFCEELVYWRINPETPREAEMISPASPKFVQESCTESYMDTAVFHLA